MVSLLRKKNDPKFLFVLTFQDWHAAGVIPANIRYYLHSMRMRPATISDRTPLDDRFADQEFAPLLTSQP
ncbi:hypothetical protein ASF70_02910 [Rhizobium sp. Leaf321]|nr:hypothetical protein ASF70_02910 [Rhizobium sp. Leaf321]